MAWIFRKGILKALNSCSRILLWDQKSPVILLDCLQLHPRDLTLCSLWVYMKFHKKRSPAFSHKYIYSGKDWEMPIYFKPVPYCIKECEIFMRTFANPTQWNLFPFLFSMQAASAGGCSAFSLGRKARMICENHMEVIIRNSNEGVLRKKKTPL